MFRCILFSLLFISNCFAYQYELSICTIFRDEAPYLKEWIEFHRMVGVQHFYLCNHASKDNYEEVLGPYIEQGIVELKEYRDPHPDLGIHYFLNRIQNPFFTETIKKTKGISKWIAFIDSDEFLVPIEVDSMRVFLKDYEDFGGVVANWQMYGTSNVYTVSNTELMVEKLTHSSVYDHPINYHVKSIVQPERVVEFRCPHHATYENGFYQVNTDKIHFDGPFSPYVQVNKLRLNHYWCRDENYLENIKIPRQISFGNTAEGTRQRNNDFNQTIELSIQRFVPELRRRMGMDVQGL